MAILLWLAWHAGGYFASSYLVAGSFALALACGLVLMPQRGRSLGRGAGIGLIGLVALTVWTGLSIRWSPAHAGSLEALQRNLSYVGLFVLALLAAPPRRDAQPLTSAVLLTITTVVVAGLASRLLPGLGLGADVSAAFPGRLSYPLTYWNAFGALAAVGIVMAVGYAGDIGTARLWRSAAAGSAVLLVVGMVLSLSRGAWVVTLVGLMVLLTLGVQRVSLTASLTLVLTFAAVAVARLSTYPALVDPLASASDRLADGPAYFVQLLALAGAAAAAQAALPRPPHIELDEASRRRLRNMGVKGMIATAAVLGIVYLAAGSRLEARSARTLHGVHRFFDHQWRDFVQPTILTSQGPERLKTVKGTRSDIYRVAIEDFRRRPLVGQGAGSFELRWIRGRRVPDYVRNAHSLYLETLSELGLIGFGLLACFLGPVAAALLRARRQVDGMPHAQVAIVGAALTVWVIHAGIDWDWQMSSLVAVMLALAAVALASPSAAAAAVQAPGRQTNPRGASHREVEPLSGL